jgi:hypothetical protein
MRCFVLLEWLASLPIRPVVLAASSAGFSASGSTFTFYVRWLVRGPVSTPTWSSARRRSVLVLLSVGPVLRSALSTLSPPALDVLWSLRPQQPFCFCPAEAVIFRFRRRAFGPEMDVGKATRDYQRLVHPQISLEACTSTVSLRPVRPARTRSRAIPANTFPALNA